MILGASIDLSSDALPVVARGGGAAADRRGRPYVSLDTGACRAAMCCDRRTDGLSPGEPVARPRRAVPGAAAARRARRQGAASLRRNTASASTSARFLKSSFVADADVRAADVGDRRGLRRFFCGAAPGPAGAGSDRRHARGRQGQLRHPLPLPSRDEMGFLVNSFNDMTKRLARAREETPRSQQAGGAAARESRGDPGAPVDRAWCRWSPTSRCAPRIRRPAPSSASISRPRSGAPIDRGRRRASRCSEQFFGAVPTPPRRRPARLARAARASVRFRQARAHVRLHGVAERRLGGAPGWCWYSTTSRRLLQAQRDAAWGEVARRLAHEIKNPLTPIQLSAERMQRKFLGSMNEQDAQILERATHTIVAQVEAMKQMVNAFSEYARAPDMHFVALHSQPADHRSRGSLPRPGHAGAVKLELGSGPRRSIWRTASEFGRS